MSQIRKTASHVRDIQSKTASPSCKQCPGCPVSDLVTSRRTVNPSTKTKTQANPISDLQGVDPHDLSA